MRDSGPKASVQGPRGMWSKLPRPVRAFLLLDSALWLLALVTELICRRGFHLSFPYDCVLLNERFPDYALLVPRFIHLHSLAFFTDRVDAPFMYPAPVAAVYKFFFLFPHGLRVYLLFSAAAFTTGAILFARALCRRGMAAAPAWLLAAFALCTSYPFMFTVNQANQEITVWCLIAVGLFSLYRHRNTPAAICFGIAMAMKIFPFVYLALFLAQKRIREIFIALAVAVGVTIPSLYLMYPNVAVAWKLDNIAIGRFRTLVTLRTYPQRGFDHSLFGAIKCFFPRQISPDRLSPLLNHYLLVVALLGLVLYVTRIRTLPFVNQVLALTIASIWLPPTSFDYTLLHLYAPWVLLVFVAMRQKENAASLLTASFLCLAVLVSPQTEIIFRGMSFGGQAKSFVLAVLFVISLVQRFDSPEDAVLAPYTVSPKATA